MKSLAVLLARFYPRSWRERYGREFDALVEDVRLNPLDLIDLLKGAVRMQLTSRKDLPLIVTLSLSGALLGVLAVSVLPQHYRSESAVGIAPDPNRAEPAVSLIAGEILKRKSLAELIEREKLFYSERQRLPLEDVIEITRRNVEIVQDPRAPNVLRLAFHSDDERTARVVAADLSRRIAVAGGGQPPQAPATSAFRPHRWSLPVAGLSFGLLTGLLVSFVRSRKRAVNSAAPIR